MSPCGIRQQETDLLQTDLLHLGERVLAIAWGMSKFRLYLARKLFILQTDHQTLDYLNYAKFYNDRAMRWSLALEGYDFWVEDIPKKNNVVAEYLRRIVMD